MKILNEIFQMTPEWKPVVLLALPISIPIFG